MCNNFFLSYHLWDTVEKYCRAGKPQLKIWRIACWIPKATDTNSEYVILLFHCNDGCTNAPQCYVMRTLPVLCFYAKHQDWPWGTPSRNVKVAPYLHLVPVVENDWSYAATPPYAFMACTDSFLIVRVLMMAFLRVTWQFSRSVCCLLFRKERCISESGSAPVHRWKGGEARIQLGLLELVWTTGRRRPYSPEEENRASKYCFLRSSR